MLHASSCFMQVPIQPTNEDKWCHWEGRSTFISKYLGTAAICSCTLTSGRYDLSSYMFTAAEVIVSFVGTHGRLETEHQ